MKNNKQAIGIFALIAVSVGIGIIISFRLESNATYLALSAKGAKLDSYDKL